MYTVPTTHKTAVQYIFVWLSTYKKKKNVSFLRVFVDVRKARKCGDDVVGNHQKLYDEQPDRSQYAVAYDKCGSHRGKSGGSGLFFPGEGQPAAEM